MLASAGFRLFANPRAARTAPYGKDGREAILSLAAFGEAKREIMSWPGYKPTPLRSLPKLAARADVGAILYKDEAERFGIGSLRRWVAPTRYSSCYARRSGSRRTSSRRRST